MLVHRALYGEHNRGHALIAHSGAPESPIAALAGRTDVPSSLPPGTTWAPYLSGYAIGDVYVFSRTFPDASASRAGMVLTHVLMLALEDAARLTRLDLVLDFLPTAPDRPAELEPVALEDAVVAAAPDAAFVSSAPRPPGLSALARMLLAAGTPVPSAPVVWLGEEGFREALVALWTVLWPDARRTLSFRISFGPADVEAVPPTIVTTPAALESRWSGYRVVRPTPNEAPASLAEAVLVGDPAGAPLADFRVALGASLTRLTDLERLERCYQYLQSGAATPSELGGLVRLLGLLSPRAEVGAPIKVPAIKRLAERTVVGTAANVKAVRNLDLAPFPNGASILDAVRSWARVHSVARTPEDADTGEVVHLAFDPDGHTAWGAAVREGLIDALASRFDVSAARAVWAWWMLAAPPVIASIGAAIAASAHAERALAEACPLRMEPRVGDAVARFAAARDWVTLHAAVVAAFLAPTDAVRRQLAIDPAPSSVRGIEQLTRRLGGAETLRAALATRDPRLVVAAGQATAAEPTLFADLDVADATWRDVWLAAIAAGAPPTAGLRNAGQTIRELLDRVVEGDLVDARLLVAVGSSPLGDLRAHPARGVLWERLPPRAREAFLATTADAWIAHFAAGGTVGLVPIDAEGRKYQVRDDDVLEPDLEAAVLEANRVDRMLAVRNPADMAVGLRLFGRFDRLPESRFIVWLEAVVVVVRRVSIMQAQAIGDLVARRRWERVALELFHRATAREDLRESVSRVTGLLPRHRRLQLRLLGWPRASEAATAEDAWDELTALAVSLYSWGPGEHDVWERAGGDFASLRQMQTGRDSWAAAIKALRLGGGGRYVSATRLLAVMREDFPQNEQVRILQQMPEFNSGR